MRTFPGSWIAISWHSVRMPISRKRFPPSLPDTPACWSLMRAA